MRTRCTRLIAFVLFALASGRSLPAAEAVTPPLVRESTDLSFAENGQTLEPIGGLGVALADFNGDGALDAFAVTLETSDSQGHRVYFGDDRGRFVASGQHLPESSEVIGPPALVDVDRDGDIDAITGRMVWLNDGHGVFTADPERFADTDGARFCRVQAGDFNGDGHPDIFALVLREPSRVYLGDGNGRFADTGQRLGDGIVPEVASGDVDGDGDVDVVTAGWTASSMGGTSDYCPNRVWLNDGHGVFSDSGQVLDEGNRHVHAIALVDIDVDGVPDLIAAMTLAPWARIYRNDGRGTFTRAETFGDGWIDCLALGDLDGGGSPDCVVGSGFGRRPTEVWLNDGHGSFRDSGLSMNNAWSAALGDLNGDGRRDVFAVSVDRSRRPPCGSTPRVYLNSSPSRVSAARNTSDYLGQTPPGLEAQVFARGLISTDHLEHSAPAFSPDGTEVFWSVWRMPDEGLPQVIMTMRREGGTWSAPAIAPFSGKDVDGGPVFSADGKRLYFATADAAPPPPGGSRIHDIVYVEKTRGGWTERKSLGLLAAYPGLRSIGSPSVTRNGTLYFMGHLAGPRNNGGIYRSELIDGQYAKPEPLPRSINLPPFLNWTPWIAPDESYLLFASNGSDTRGACDLYISRRRENGSWTDPVNLGEPVNTPRQERFQAISPDGKYLFFTRPTPGHSQDVYWIATDAVPALRPSTELRPGKSE